MKRFKLLLTVLILVAVIGCEMEDEDLLAVGYYKIGDKGPGGGTVYSTNGVGKKYFEISNELSKTYTWNEVPAIIEAYNDDVNGGKSDWIWPSVDELNRARHALYAPGEPLHDTSLINYIWSSSEYDTNYAWGQNFYDGSQDYYYKTYYYFNVRVVRAF